LHQFEIEQLVENIVATSNDRLNIIPKAGLDREQVGNITEQDGPLGFQWDSDKVDHFHIQLCHVLGHNFCFISFEEFILQHKAPNLECCYFSS